MKKMMDVYYHPFLWRLKMHVGEKGNRYSLDMNAKIKWLFERLKDDDGINFKIAKPLIREDFYRVHDRKYVDNVFNGNLEEIKKYSWVTWGASFVRAQLYTSGIIYDAISEALKNKSTVGCLAIDGHHARKTEGSGFCTFHHLAVALEKIVLEKKLEKVLIVDLDCHLGDGTLELLGKNPRVAIFDIYGQIHRDGIEKVGNRHLLYKANNVNDYFKYLERLDGCIEKERPDLVCYIAGVDVYKDDRYSGIDKMSVAEIKKRDQYVFNLCRKSNIPTVFTLGGGYVKYPDIDGKKRKTLVDLHRNTFLAAKE